MRCRRTSNDSTRMLRPASKSCGIRSQPASITACTIAALLVCVVIAALFLEVMLGAPFKWLIGVLFTGAMLALVVGLSFFLREVQLSMHSVHARIVGRKKA